MVPQRLAKRFGRLVSRSALVAGGILAGFVLLEVCLQGTALLVKATGREASPGWLTGRTRVLALGDSNTYGLFVEPSQAYPRVLEGLWNERRGVAAIEVLNVGYPGTSSSQLRVNFDRFLSVFRPDVITVMIGTNDHWTAPVPVGEDVDTQTRIGSTLWRISRVYRLLYMLRRSLQGPSLSVSNPYPREVSPDELEYSRSEQGFAQMQADLVRSLSDNRMKGEGVIRYGGESIRVSFVAAKAPNWPRSLRRNLEWMASRAASAGVRFVVLTYPSGMAEYAGVNRVIRETALANDFELIDLEPRFQSKCPNWDCDEFLPDHRHPSPAGHALAAGLILERMR